MRRAPWAIGVVGAAIGYIGAGVPSYWGDEAASVLSAERSWASLSAELSTVDAVHGLYYALLHVWVSVFGSSEWATRALSSIGIGFLAAGVVVLGIRWSDERTAVLAGLIVPVIPRAGVLAVETRGYAIAAALAVWVTVLLVGLVDRDARRRWWVVYGAAVALSGTFFLYLLLMPAVHLGWMLVQRSSRRVLRRWLWSLLIAGVLAAPIILVAQQQRHQLSFLLHRSYMNVPGWFVTPWFGHLPAAIVLAPLLVVGAVAAFRGRERMPGTLPVLVWVITPGVVLVVLDLFVSPTYNPRYLSISLGGVALLLAAGVWTALDLARGMARRRGLALATVVLIVVASAVLVPEFVRQRTPFAKDGGADGRAAAAVIAAEGRPGDVVLFGTDTRPSRAPRLIYRLYPEAFAGMRDPQLRIAADATDGLWDHMATVTETVAGLSASTCWLIETGSTGSAADDVRALDAAGFAQVSRTVIHRTVIYEFQKETPS